jgi:hypothetical protein
MATDNKIIESMVISFNTGSQREFKQINFAQFSDDWYWYIVCFMDEEGKKITSYFPKSDIIAISEIRK